MEFVLKVKVNNVFGEKGTITSLWFFIKIISSTYVSSGVISRLIASIFRNYL